MTHVSQHGTKTLTAKLASPESESHLLVGRRVKIVVIGSEILGRARLLPFDQVPLQELQPDAEISKPPGFLRFASSLNNAQFGLKELNGGQATGLIGAGV